LNDLFLRACMGEAVERTPVWIMRQAGRYMAQYREVRAKHSFWTICRTPELATKVTMQPIDRLGVDAAILFSDILVVLPAMGLDVAFNPGPQLAQPLRTSADIDALRHIDPLSDLGFVLEAVKSIRREIDGRIPLIGFGGAPLTLAAYMVEGGGSKNFMHLKGLFHEEPKNAKKLMSFLVDAQADYLNAQIDAGVQAIQIFDTWAGNMSRRIYREFVLEPVTQLIERIKRPSVPVIYFIRDAAHVLDLLASIGADVISVDDKLPLSTVAEMIGPGPSLQGNLDSTVLLGSRESILEGVKRVLEDAPGDRGHIFNLSHGILPPTPEENASYMVDTVKHLSLEKT
jgi:uroporphyrinogen decarboxylase